MDSLSLFDTEDNAESKQEELELRAGLDVVKMEFKEAETMA